MSAQHMQERSGGSEIFPLPWKAAAGENAATLTHQQQRLHVQHSLMAAATPLCRTLVLSLPEPVEPARLQWALEALYRRHAALQHHSPIVADDPPVAEPGLPVLHRLSVVWPGWQGVSALIPDAPGWWLLEDTSGHYLLLARLSVLQVDGPSAWRLMHELLTLYAGLPLDDPLTPPSAALWQHSDAGCRAAEDALAAWRQWLPPDPPEWPLDHPRPRVLGAERRQVSAHLAREAGEALAARAAALGVSAQRLVLGLYCLWLQRLAGQQPVAVGLVMDPRVCAAPLAGAVGVLEQRLPLAMPIASDESLSAWMDALEQRLTWLQRGALAPATELLSLPGLAVGAAHTPLFQAAFDWQQEVTLEITADLAVSGWSEPPVMPDAELSLGVHVRASGEWVCSMHYSPELFEGASVAGWLESLCELLRVAPLSPERPVRHLPWVSAAQREQLLAWDEPVQQPTERGAGPHWLRERALAWKTQPAVRDAARTLDYDTLWQLSSRLAHALRAQGVAPGERVGVALPRDALMLPALLAIWEAGACYVPLDLDHPEERLLHVVRQSGMAWVLAGESLTTRLPALEGVQVLGMEALLAAAEGPDLPPPPPPADDALAYIIFTSGSTGVPKGVAVTHANVKNLLLAMASTPGMGPGDVSLAITTLAFDMCKPELFLPLATGACCAILTREEARDGRRLQAAMDHFGATFMQATPTTWRLLLQAGWQGRPALRVVVGGEPVPLPLAQTLLERVREVWNCYGPTETTVWSTAEQLRAPLAQVTIGRALRNTRLYVLDDEGRLQPPGVAGELYIGGDGVAAGYWGDAEKTAQRFLPDPFHSGRMYRTGDLVRRLGDGQLVYLRRVDTQVKLRGYRIETGEIESLLLAEPGVASAAAVVREVAEGDERLVAYVAPAADAVLDATRLRGRLAECLPAYMVPWTVELLDALPLTPSGKLDRQRLPAPTVKPASSDADMTPLEHQLAALWSSVLGGPVGPEDDFFALGGHSLLAVDIFRRIDQEFGVDLPLGTLFQGPTVRSLARHLEAHGEAGRWRPAVCLRAGEPGATPLFCFHPVGGNVLHYAGLLASLPAGNPLYGLQAVGLDGRSVPLTDMQAMSRRYADEILSIQPRGPYRLAGGSFGGVIALETARRLQEAGEVVEWVIMFDTLGPDARKSRSRLAGPGVGWRHSLAQRWRDFWRYCRCRGLLRQGQPLPHHLRYWWVTQSNFKALAAYLGSGSARQPYAGNVALMRLPLDADAPYAEPLLGWAGVLAGRVEVRYMEGSHAAFIEAPAFREAFTALWQQLD